MTLYVGCDDRYYILVLMGVPTPYIARYQCVSFLHNTVMICVNVYPVCFICIFIPHIYRQINKMAQVALISFVLVFMNEIGLVNHSHLLLSLC